MSAMARSHLGRRASATAALLCAAAPALTGAAAAREDGSITAPLTITVTSVTPSFARQGRTVTISGLVRNLSGSAVTGLSVSLLSSRAALTSRQELESFAAGRYTPPEAPVRVKSPAKQRLPTGESWRWTIKLPAGSLGTRCFGVYPLTVHVGDSVFQAASDQVPLPYWPAKPASCPGLRRPRPFPISWIWPLVDTPHQDVCAGLTGNALAASIAPQGRLGFLLAVGARYATKAALTWAIDPALLDSVRTMKQRYRAGVAPACHRRSVHQASPYAARWLSGLKRATAGQPVFVTPYADVDVAALVRHGNAGDLRGSITNGEQAAHLVLGRRAVPAALPAGHGRLSAIAWPPGGSASDAVLTSIGNSQISTVVLANPPVSPVTYTPGAVTSARTLTGKKLHILLADRRITAELRSGLVSSHAAGARVHVSQLYLAETAMIAAEAAGMTRPIVVAPPRRWDPTSSLAGQLLGETIRAPWLRPSTASQLVAMKPEHVYKKVTQYGPIGAHSKRLLNSVSKLDRKIALLQAISVPPNPRLYRAVANIESSAWRGKAAKQATATLQRTWRYVDSQLHGVTISSGNSGHAPYHVTFGGKTAPVNVNIHNGLNYTVTVGLLVQASKATVTGQPGSITVGPHSFSRAVTLTVHAKAAHVRLRLSLTAPQSSKLRGHPLPAAPLVILIHPTEFGIIALVIVAIALALFVIASAFRAIRNGRPGLPGESAEPDGPDDSGFAPNQSAMPGADAGADTIPDWGKATTQRSGPAELGNRPEHTDGVGHDQSELTPAGPAAADQEAAEPSWRANQERG
jgi:hypothetical protein